LLLLGSLSRQGKIESVGFGPKLALQNVLHVATGTNRLALATRIDVRVSVLKGLMLSSKALFTVGITSWAITNAWAGQVIGPEAAIPLPKSAIFSGPINFQPGDGDTVQINPPSIQWCYVPDATVAHSDMEMKTFLLQVAYDSGFSSLALNVTSYWNFYSTLAPFIKSPVYWKVGYCHGSNSTAYAWSAVRSFTIATNALNWNRSMLTDPLYVSGKGHPFISVKPSTRVAASNFLFTAINAYNSGTTDHSMRDLGYGFKGITNIASRALTNSFWPAGVPPSPWTGASGEWAVDVGDVCLMWAVTRSPVWSNAHPELALQAMANYYITNNGYRSDVIGNSQYDDMERTLALGYDWCYDLMDTTTRSNVLNALAYRCRYILCGFDTAMWDSKNPSYTDGKGDPSGAYVDGFITRPYSQAKWGHSHGTDNYHNAMIMALAGAADHPWCKGLFDYGVNYMLGPSYVYANVMGVGRPYTLVHMFENKMLNTHVIFQMALPEVGWTNNPFWAKAADWWDRVLPVQMYQGHEPWGDTTYGYEGFWQDDKFGRQLTFFTGNGRYLRHWKREWEFWTGPLNHGSASDNFWTALIPFSFPYTNIIETDTTNLAALYAKEGWVISASGTPSSASSFTNGVGLIFQARPAGAITGHALPSDGSFQMWAYGAPITDGAGLDMYGGYCGYEKVPWSHYTLLVNGLGQCQPQYRTVEPWYSRIYAYTNCDAFTYCAADLTRAYARSNFLASGDTLPAQFAALHSGGPLSYVGNVTREILFNRKKYFVIYDTMQTGNAPTNTFTWIYHVMENTLNLNAQAMSFTYTATNAYNQGNVSVYVSHIVAPNLMSVTDLTGTSVRVNPITGENYWTNAPPSNLGDKWPRAHALWFSNKTPTNNWHFMSVIYPVKPGAAAPQITRLDDYTVAVTNGVEGDVIGFNTNSPFASRATLMVNSSAISGSTYVPPVRPAPPLNLRAPGP
jgi:hypothetical protein